ncbi:MULTISPECIES: hydrogenase maturation nickel metallochaperone HypA/HybF [Paraburkholderia]|uniref:Hydrogenase maturation factor HypA n=4 Tax=Paraburkholderia TaxID=1822464 RepID=A0A1H7EIN0_9BURK|nr:MULTISPECIES: hydrogenase maturation nickel metallochaperone HypA [Paraburkholderia]PTB24284.1 hydrogenase maturation nickel metallochaperone HypA [Paraburkholderia caribensis]SEK11500.1 hydrogenase nickel incorporation protein HypA/HybF [Paraburkholderia diazotrophica]ACC76250.1 hydrogenase expression/synthesis HypA [Paraburkholderia phymatum STM815]AFT89943.1 hydrogenase nickel incorporation protein hypA [Paraburkholderia phenoliruptrix BR3459a]CAB4052940.1 Hydrogenase maturation factor H
MHEVSVAEGIRDVIEDEARRHQYRCVREIGLEVGQLANVDTRALRFALDVALRGSLANGSVVTIHEPPGHAWCMRCGDTVELRRRGVGCPACGSYQLAVTDGDQMRIIGMVVD